MSLFNCPDSKKMSKFPKSQKSISRFLIHMFPTRCHLPTGQIRWLCREHSEAAHIRVLSSDIAIATTHKPMLSEEDRLLSRYINEYANAIEQWPALSAEGKNKLLSGTGTALTKNIQCTTDLIILFFAF